MAKPTNDYWYRIQVQARAIGVLFSFIGCMDKPEILIDSRYDKLVKLKICSLVANDISISQILHLQK